MQHVRTVDQLVQLSSKGARPKFVFFWGHTPAADGSVTKSCFSQWWKAPFNVDGVSYPTAEHFMMAGKARLFGDHATEEKILAAKHPKQAKDLGRKVANFNEAAWNEARFDIVVAANYAKFSQNPPLQEFLLQTKARVLVEASPVDSIWGIGLAADDERAEKPSKWKGLNLLGFALMEVRERLSNISQ